MKASPIISINYIVPIKGVWKGKAQFVSEGGVGIYDGNWKDGLPHGHGKFENNEYMYEGEFTNGDRHGIGNENTMIWKVGIRKNAIYKGGMNMNKMSGYGELKNVSKKYKYVGHFKNSMFNGEGILKRNGRMYEGIFEDGKFVKGQYVDHANRTFIGHFTSNNKLNGTGLIQFQDGFVVNGTFINNKLQVEKYDDVVPAIGKFDGRKHGLLETKLGWYIGKWKDKKPHDKNGRIYGDRGGRFSGEIRKGKKVRGIEYFSDGRKFTGKFKSNRPIEGKMIFHGQNNNNNMDDGNNNIIIDNDDDNNKDKHNNKEEHSFFEGTFNEKGLPTGNGIEYNSKTQILYNGFFLNGKFYNNGTIKFANNFIWTGKFNKKHGLPNLPFFIDIIPLKGTFGPVTASLSRVLNLEKEELDNKIDEENIEKKITQIIKEIIEMIIVNLVRREDNSNNNNNNDEDNNDEFVIEEKKEDIFLDDTKNRYENEEKTEISSNLDEDINADDDTELFESNFRLYHGFFHDRQFHGEGCVINFHDGTHKTGVWNMGVLIEKKVLYTSSS